MHVDRSLAVLQDVDSFLVRETLETDAVDTEDLIASLQHALLHGCPLINDILPQIVSAFVKLTLSKTVLTKMGMSP